MFELNFFVIKKWLGHLLMPLPFSLSLLVLALVLLWFTRFQKGYVPITCCMGRPSASCKQRGTFTS
ncbi:hypothetical protein ACK31G_19685, partial [Aeromonas caviae]